MLQNHSEPTPADLRHIVPELLHSFTDNLRYVGLHGSFLDICDVRNEDIDIVLLFSSITKREIEALRRIKEESRLRNLHFLPFTENEVRLFPPEYRLQFFYGHQPLWKRIRLAAPSRNELLRYLNIKLIERIIIRLRNFWLLQFNYYSSDLNVLLRRLLKEVYWWWRIYVFIDTGAYHGTCQALIESLMPYQNMHSCVIDLLFIYQDRDNLQNYDKNVVFDDLNLATAFMIDCYYRLNSKMIKEEIAEITRSCMLCKQSLVKTTVDDADYFYNCQGCGAITWEISKFRSIADTLMRYYEHEFDDVWEKEGNKQAVDEAAWSKWCLHRLNYLLERDVVKVFFVLNDGAEIQMKPEENSIDFVSGNFPVKVKSGFLVFRKAFFD